MSTPAIKKLLILNTILLVVILMVLLILNFRKLKNVFVTNSDDIYESIDADYPDIRYYLKQDSPEVDFSGLKNDSIPLPDEIIETITTELNANNWNDEFQTEILYNLFHETVFAKQFSLDPATSKRFIVITFSNHGGNHYHAARGVISLFEFQKQHHNWLMTRKYFAFGYGTEYGLEPLWCKLVNIGNNNKYGVIVQTDYSGNGGHEVQSQAVYSEVGCSFELVFDFINYEHYEDYPKDVEYTEGYSNMHFLKSDKAWFDIETKGEDSDWHDKTPGAVKHFVFNGKEYVETNRNIHTSAN
jgi:hypothetical protein